MFVCAHCPYDDTGISQPDPGRVIVPMHDGVSLDSACPVDECPSCGSIGGMTSWATVAVTRTIYNRPVTVEPTGTVL